MSELEKAKVVREKGEFALRVIDGGHRSESALIDLLAYTKQLRTANCRHVLNHIENICEKCGHTKAEDGCPNCITVDAAKRTSELERENAQWLNCRNIETAHSQGFTVDGKDLATLNNICSCVACRLHNSYKEKLSSQHDDMQLMVAALQLISTDIGSTHAANKAKETLSTLKTIKPYV